MSLLLSNGTGGDDVSNLGVTMETVGTLRRMQLSQEALQGLSSSTLCTLSCGTAASCKLRDVYGTLVAECRCDQGYCHNSGTCEFLQGTGPVCRCGADPSGFYSGPRCELYAPRALVILVGAGVGGLLVLLTSVLSVCLCVKNRLNQLDSEKGFHHQDISEEFSSLQNGHGTDPPPDCAWNNDPPKIPSDQEFKLPRPSVTTNFD
ncbi:PREDICTED: chondroitin sulfate proteoglycan 5-like [Branchiostoma belcheri]|uniref:Chondroitin sulfate proteoglycan 5-like n=1 Tax=Branchiostoma belcheri TaxID=7741 RepID=A0A6P4YA48_BRABE|nr:PREDICTED: chondroitin sulfate proteoglycan 5-like [Branchiostoma belcheri]